MSRSKVKRSLSSFIHVSSKAGSDRGSSTSDTETLTPRKYEKKKKKFVTIKKEYDHTPHEVGPRFMCSLNAVTHEDGPAFTYAALKMFNVLNFNESLLTL